MDPNEIYDPDYVADLFDRCTLAYRRWSAVASFGMVRRWRKLCVKNIPSNIDSTGVFFDLMAGTGEVWPHLLTRYPDIKNIKAIDNSIRMHESAMAQLHKQRSDRISHLKANVLDVDLPANAADCVLSTFGLKTFNVEQQNRIAQQVHYVLKPNGTFCFIEASDPTSWVLHPFYRFYMDQCLPLVERLALKGAQDFSMIGTYTKHFHNCDDFKEALIAQGLIVHSFEDFFGCATGVYGSKPAN